MGQFFVIKMFEKIWGEGDDVADHDSHILEKYASIKSPIGGTQHD